MKTPLLFFIFLCLSLTVLAEELPWFSLHCNLRNADLIVQAEIIDRKGTLRIEKYLKGAPLPGNKIRLDDFQLNKKQKGTSAFPKAKKKKLVLFIDLEVGQEPEPSFWSWELSTLWIEEGKYMGVIQMENPGGYVLYPYYESFSALKSEIDNWLFLSDVVEKVTEIPSSKDRLHYLDQLFDWHPFKVEVLNKMAVEEALDEKYMEEIIWKMFRYPFLTKVEIYECFWMDYELENYHQIGLSLYKEVLQEKYDQEIQQMIRSYKSNIDYMEWKSNDHMNETFLFEFAKFLNKNPPKNWEEEKAAIQLILEKNNAFYNKSFLGKLKMSLGFK